MIVCHLVPALRAVRRVAVARPRVVAPAAVAGAVVRRAPRPLLVCRDTGALAGMGTLAGSAPAIAPPLSAAGAGAPPPGGEAGAGVPLAGAPLPGGGTTAGPPGIVPPSLPPGLLFPPGAPPLPDRPGGDLTGVVVRVPEAPGPVQVPEPSALALFVAALLIAGVAARRRLRPAGG